MHLAAFGVWPGQIYEEHTNSDYGECAGVGFRADVILENAWIHSPASFY